jgi:type I restriction enzyme, S subunit
MGLTTVNAREDRGWTEVSVGALARFSSGKGISVSALHTQSHVYSIPVYGGNGIAGYTEAPCVFEPTIVVGRVGQRCGEVHFADGPSWVTDNALYPMRILQPLDLRFFGLALGAAGLNNVKNRNDLPLVTQTILHSVRIPWPRDIGEQRVIAAAVSDVDALLVTLDRLIAKKRDLKQAAMQRLLTGRTRLPGFCGKWETTTLGALGSWFSGGTPSKANETYWSGDIPWVSPKDMKVARIRDAIDHVGQTAIGNGTRLLPTGAILIVVRGMILAHSAPVARIERPVAFNQDIKGLVVRSDIDSNFALWWLVAHEAILLSLTNEATHGTKRIPTDELFKMKLRVPSLDEQAAVARVVTDMDDELEVLEQRRDKTELLKQGMMQELLTGRTRLV